MHERPDDELDDIDVELELRSRKARLAGASRCPSATTRSSTYWQSQRSSRRRPCNRAGRYSGAATASFRESNDAVSPAIQGFPSARAAPVAAAVIEAVAKRAARGDARVAVGRERRMSRWARGLTEGQRRIANEMGEKAQARKQKKKEEALQPSWWHTGWTPRRCDHPWDSSPRSRDIEPAHLPRGVDGGRRP